MKILVCISKAPDTTSRIAFTEGDTKFDENGVQFIVNPYDEWYALVRGLELKEAAGGSVTTVTVGGADNDPVIRKALAIGADNAVRIEADPADAFDVANQIATYAKEQGFDLILTGKETINYNSGVTGALIAEMLDMPYVALATKLDMNGNTATITREVSGGSEVVEVNTPLVLSAAKGMAEQRIPNMRGIMAARTKPLEVVQGVASAAQTSITSYALPPAKGDVKLIDPENVEELVKLLHTEAKVI